MDRAYFFETHSHAFSYTKTKKDILLNLMGKNRRYMGREEK